MCKYEICKLLNSLMSITVYKCQSESLTMVSCVPNQVPSIPRTTFGHCQIEFMNACDCRAIKTR